MTIKSTTITYYITSASHTHFFHDMIVIVATSQKREVLRHHHTHLTPLKSSSKKKGDKKIIAHQFIYGNRTKTGGGLTWLSALVTLLVPIHFYYLQKIKRCIALRYKCNFYSKSLGLWSLKVKNILLNAINVYRTFKNICHHITYYDLEL